MSQIFFDNYSKIKLPKDIIILLDSFIDDKEPTGLDKWMYRMKKQNVTRIVKHKLFIRLLKQYIIMTHLQNNHMMMLTEYVYVHSMYQSAIENIISIKPILKNKKNI